MLLYTLAGDDDAARMARDLGVDQSFSHEISRVCVPLDANSLRRSWARMAMAPTLGDDQIELLEVDAYDAVALWRAFDESTSPRGAEVEDILFPTDPARIVVLLPRTLRPSRVVRMSARRIADGDVRDALHRAVKGVRESFAPGVPVRSRLMFTGVAAFAWAQATRADLAPEILSVNAGELAATGGVARALRVRGLPREQVGPEAAADALHAMESGLDELAHRLAVRRARTYGATIDLPCYCGSGRPYTACCGAKGLDGIAKDW